MSRCGIVGAVTLALSGHRLLSAMAGAVGVPHRGEWDHFAILLFCEYRKLLSCSEKEGRVGALVLSINSAQSSADMLLKKFRK